MCGVLEGYAPGYGADAVSMMAARTAAERATFAQPLFRPGTWVVDLGCGPGSITLGLAAESRVTGIDRDAGSDSTNEDPSMNAIRPPYTAAFNDYVRRELGYKSDVEYYILGGGITAPWNYNVSNGYADTSMPLKDAMAKNPYMKIFVGCGYYDMATPFYAAEYTVSAMNLDPELRKNVSFEYYEAGHMMYIEKNSLAKLKKDASAFIQSALRR